MIIKGHVEKTLSILEEEEKIEIINMIKNNLHGGVNNG
jgi:hypothetical protein